MGRSLNKVQLIGNLATDPELKYTANGSMVCNFVIATNRRFKRSDGTLGEDAQFTTIVSWGKLAEVCQKILGKGMLAYVEGRINTRSWDAQDGTKRYKTEVRAAEVILLDSKDRDPAGIPDDLEGGPSSSSGGGSDSDNDSKKRAGGDKDDSSEISDEELEEILSEGESDDDDDGDEDDEEDEKEDKKKK